MKKTFIGIDFSKETMDAAIIQSSTDLQTVHSKFENSEEGSKKMIKWIRTQVKGNSGTWLFCGEHTGIYSLTLAAFLAKKGIDMWLESALQIKKSQGIVRGKTDKIDAENIALYAYRFQDKAKLYHLPSKTLSGLKDLMAYRERLKGMIQCLSLSSKELKRVKTSDETVQYIVNDSEQQIKALRQTLKKIETRILGLVKTDEEVKKNYEIVESVKGIGMVNAVTILVTTQNFTTFTDPRKFSCYCGSAPFQQQSGTSLKSKNRVSKLANKKVKAFLTQAAESAVQNNKILKQYYQRKRADGKDHYLVINNVRNKLIHTIFRLVAKGQKYDQNYSHPLSQVA